MPKHLPRGIELLADPTRRRIVALIARGVRRPSHLAWELGRSRPAVSRQLGLLVGAGLIEPRPYPADGRSLSYHLRLRAEPQIVAWLALTEVGLSRGRRPETLPPPAARSDIERITGQRLDGAVPDDSSA